MKHFFIGLIFLWNTSVSAQLNVSVQWLSEYSSVSNDTIFYDIHRKLTWKDFKGKPDFSSNAAAITFSGFGYKLSMKAADEKGTVIIFVYCFFSKLNSWVKSGMSNEYALTHEQHHYDITYLWTNRFIKRLKAADINFTNYKTIVEKIYDDCFRELKNNQEDYDNETRNGQLKNEQEGWNKKIEDQLISIPKD